jgi:hypothetical protein
LAAATPDLLTKFLLIVGGSPEAAKTSIQLLSVHPSANSTSPIVPAHLATPARKDFTICNDVQSQTFFLEKATLGLLVGFYSVTEIKQSRPATEGLGSGR